MKTEAFVKIFILCIIIFLVGAYVENFRGNLQSKFSEEEFDNGCDFHYQNSWKLCYQDLRLRNNSLQQCLEYNLNS